jgi:DNA-binding response OmpR family regulator
MPHKVLVVEDEMTLLETLAYNLTRQGYKVFTAKTGNEALDTARLQQPDLVVLDIMLPGIDGFEVCRILRKEMSVPILMLTARDEEVDKIVGLEVGADDYMTKPFSMRELLARVKALLRRVRLIREELASEESASDSAAALGGPSGATVEVEETMTFGNLEIDQARREVRKDGEPVRLKLKEYELLVFLARNRGIALSRDLREKIEEEPSNARRIITVRGIGYRFDG